MAEMWLDALDRFRMNSQNNITSRDLKKSESSATGRPVRFNYAILSAFGTDRQQKYHDSWVSSDSIAWMIQEHFSSAISLPFIYTARTPTLMVVALESE